MMTNLKMTMGAVCAALALTAAATPDWPRANYPDYMKRWPQLKGVMLGATGETEFKDLRRMGATLVRYQMANEWKNFTALAGQNKTDAAAEYDKWLDERLDHLEKMLVWSRKYGIKICVDLHTHIGGLTKEEYNSDMIFVEKKYEDLLVATWEKIARRFKGNQDAIYGYDLFNEPIDRENELTTTSWRAVICRTVEAIRVIDPDTPIIIEPNCNASPRGFDVKNPYGLKGFEPLPYGNLIYSVHIYQPMGFTHQGLFQKKEDYKPMPYPSANAKADPNRKRYPGDLGKDSGKVETWNKEYVRREIQTVREFQLKYGVRIWVGEFSAAGWTDGGDRYLQDVTDLFEEYGWDYAYHAFRENVIWSLEHEGDENASLRKAEQETPRMKVMKAKWALNANAK